VSNAIRYDALLVRDLAAELHRTLAGARLEGVFLDRDTLRLTLRTRAPRRRQADPPSLLWQLHPEAGHLSVSEPAGTLPGSVQLGTPTTITRIHAPPDERIIFIDLTVRDAPAGAARCLAIELVTNQWNAIAVGAERRITAVLRERETRGRILRAGSVYEPPGRAPRAGASEPLSPAEWHGALGIAAPGERLGALLRWAAYTSPLNSAAILGDADVSPEGSALDRALSRYVEMVWTAERTPMLLWLDGRWQPYSRPLPGGDGSEAAATLLQAFSRAAERAAAVPVQTVAIDGALTALSQRIDAIDRRMQRLRAEQEGAGTEAAHLRAQADLLLTHLHRIERGAERVRLDDFAGGRVDIDLDPTMNAAGNATRLYDTARKRDRAAARIPDLLTAAAKERRRVERLIERVRSGDLDSDELARIQPLRRTAKRGAGPPLPYRGYRTSGGLEVRVGRGSRANDDLTFRHSRPTDIWLHARDVAGAHVILRWDRADENPPAGAITEAAVLAALFSRARTSATVAVDWTRRKHVRKPRRSAPGLVLPERVKTVFVQPDPSMEERMRTEG
jgi:predicted ribosome quality control (RQC) complex YloA/Tae2 family protein